MYAKYLLGFIATAALAIGFSTVADAQTPKRGGVLIVALEGEPPNLDCHQSTSIFVPQLVRPIYSNLVRYDTNDYPKIVGDLAESWNVSSDGLTYTFKVRTGVRFHDGSPFSSEDVKASFDRVRNPPQGVSSLRRADFADVTSIDTPDATTVVFKLSSSNAAFIELLANPFQCIYSAKKLAAAPLYPMTEPMGTGPFQFVQYQRGALFEGKRFDGYFRQGLPYLDGYKQQVITFGAPAVNALIAGQVDANVRGLQPAELATVRAAVGDKVTVQESPIITVNMVEINNRRKPLDDVRVRKALSLAIDRKGELPGIQKIMNQVGYGGILRPGTAMALPIAETDKLLGTDMPIAQARAEARRLLAEAGQSNMQIALLNRDLPIFTPMGIFLIDQWRQIGLDVKHELINPTTVVSRVNPPNFDFDLTINTGAGPTDDPTVLLTKYLPDSPANLSGFKDPLLLELFNKQKGELNAATRKALANQFERQVLSQAYLAPVFWSGNTYVMRNNIHGWKITPVYQLGYDLIEVWKD